MSCILWLLLIEASRAVYSSAASHPFTYMAMTNLFSARWGMLPKLATPSAFFTHTSFHDS